VTGARPQRVPLVSRDRATLHKSARRTAQTITKSSK
jgi:hypothetical protein